MASQPSQTLTKRSVDSALMPPPPPPKRIKRPATVLDEDVYTDALSHIIKRDFFPGLLESDVQQEYLDAIESRDKGWIAEAGAKLTQTMTPGPDGRRIRGRRGTRMTPVVQRGGETPKGWTGDTPRGWVGDTPMSVAPSEAGTEKTEDKPEVNVNMSLSAFQTKYTSEDNESFYALVDKQNAKRRETYSWLYNGNKIPAKRQIAYREREARLLEGSKENQDGESSDKQLIRRPIHPDDRPAMPETRRPEARNTFMFNPESIADTHPTQAQVAEAASNAPPKAVAYDNTRLPPPAPEQPSVPPSPSLSAINDAIAGRPRPTESEAGDQSQIDRYNGYELVNPNPTRRELGEESSSDSESDEETDLLSLLGPADDSPNPFKISLSSKREALHHAMVEKTAQQKRAAANSNRMEALMAGQGAEGKTPTPKFLSATPRRAVGNLTPAAQRLLGTMGTPVR
ncbi:hypothetical protein NA57DRAFT_25893, partial [Rhizodiscina lignyota]